MVAERDERLVPTAVVALQGQSGKARLLALVEEALEIDDVKPAPKADNEVKQPRENANGNALGNDLATPGNAREFDPRMLN